MKRGVLQAMPGARLLSLPLSDGGEGFVDAMLFAKGGEKVFVKVTGPLGEPVRAFYGLTGAEHEIAVLEMAAASGLQYVPLRLRNPLKTTTFGTGELILHALDRSVRTLIIGIGGSATHDVACGAAQALGARFSDADGRVVDQKMSGAILQKIYHVDLSYMTSRLNDVNIQVACDVNNPLLGPLGAAKTYARQKGADERQIEILESGTRHIIDLIESAAGQRVREIPGSGAAGGMGAGFMAFMGATLQPGIRILLKNSDIERQIRGIDYILTGEGCTDSQTLHGKTVQGIVETAEKYEIPVIIMSGQIKNAKLFVNRVHSMVSLSRQAGSTGRSLERPAFWIEKTAEKITRDIMAG